MDIVVTRAISLAGIVLVGYAIKRLGWVRREHFSVLAIIVLRVTLPCALITSFNDFVITGTLTWLIVIGAAVNLIQQGATWLLTRHDTARRRSFAILHSGSYNVGAFAMPYAAQFAGPAAIVYTAMFDIGNSIAAGGIGYGWAMMIARGESMSLRRLAVTMLRSPVFDTYLVLLFLQLAHIRLPEQIIGFTSLIGQANPFCAMLMIGVGLDLALPARAWATAAKFLARRYAFVIVFCLLMWYAIPSAVLSDQIKTIVIVVLWAPVAVMIAGFVDEAHGDVRLASLIASISVIIAIIMMPVVYMVLG
ncbi:MAG: hypothetical protein LBV06_05785 [Propionibacteriaceae bacterium]|nr:hypothetical protein [Propionibacteriaceae bacterium]